MTDQVTLDTIFRNCATQIEFKSEELTRLQVYWEHFLKRDKMENLPATIVEMIDKVNAFLKKLYER